MDIIKDAGKRVYQIHRWKEKKRYATYLFRCWWHKKEVTNYLDFFQATPLRQQILNGSPALLEQITRGFFYKDSTWQERIELVKKHIEILESKLNEDALLTIYGKDQPLQIWQDEYEGKPLTLSLVFQAGQRKEGSLSLSLFYDNDWLYQIMFWIGGTKEEPKIYIGALQGLLNGSELIKGLTKAYFGYRTKNLIFYCMRAFARELGCSKIYAVTNDGYYAQNHFRLDRKLKTDFAEFWAECEGVPADDKRFYVMPIAEHRKSMEELKPSKRAQHRRRFEKLDEIDSTIHNRMAEIMK